MESTGTKKKSTTKKKKKAVKEPLINPFGNPESYNKINTPKQKSVFNVVITSNPVEDGYGDETVVAEIDVMKEDADDSIVTNPTLTLVLGFKELESKKLHLILASSVLRVLTVNIREEDNLSLITPMVKRFSSVKLEEVGGRNPKVYDFMLSIFPDKAPLIRKCKITNKSPFSVIG